MNNDRITNDQRKKLGKLIGDRLDKFITEKYESNHEIRSRIIQQVKEEQGIPAIKARIKQLEEELEKLKEEKYKAGFWLSSDSPVEGSDAEKKIADKYTAERTDIEALADIKDRLVSEVLLATSLEDAKKLVEEAFAITA